MSERDELDDEKVLHLMGKFAKMDADLMKALEEQ